MLDNTCNNYCDCKFESFQFSHTGKVWKPRYYLLYSLIFNLVCSEYESIAYLVIAIE